MQSTKLKASFGWVGGKSKLSKDIIEAISEDHTTYVEVFGGALSVFYGKEPSKLEIVNDINSELVNLHRAIRSNPETLSMYLNQLLISREIFDDIKHKRMKPRNKIEAAASTSNYVLLKYNNSPFKAGTAEDNKESKYSYVILDNLFVNYLNIDHKTTELIIVTGDSMEPTINNNTMVFIDKKIADEVNGIYAFETPQGLFVKRLELHDGIYKVISDNDKYEAQYSLGGDLSIIGKVSGQLARI